MTLYCPDCPFTTSDSNILGEHVATRHPYWKHDKTVVSASLLLFLIFFLFSLVVKLQ